MSSKTREKALTLPCIDPVPIALALFDVLELCIAAKSASKAARSC